MDEVSSQSTGVEPPPEIVALGAYGARFLPLKPGTKEPNKGGHGRTNAVPWDDFFKLPEENYGITLDGWALTVDIDNPNCDPAKFLMKRLGEHPTLRQKTRKGKHWVFLIPPGGQRFHNGNLVDESTGLVYGQILTNSYIVGAGSRIGGEQVYFLEDGRSPVTAPDWLVEIAQKTTAKGAPGSAGPRRDQIPMGERDNALGSILGQIARSKANLSEAALRKIAKGLIDLGVIEDGQGYLQDDPGAVTRLVRSAISFGDRKPEVDAMALLPDEWRTGDEIDVAPMPTAWLPGLEGLLPGVGLSLMYGDGKVGKTSALAWLAAVITARGLGVIYLASGETTFDEFVRMVAMYDKAQPGLVYEYPNPGLFVLPDKCGDLEQALELIGSGIACVLIDAVYSHFAPTPGSHEAARARYAMKPLNEVAQRRGLAILGTIHENAAGGMLGSREMRNVARGVIRAVRKPGTPLTLYGAGANVPQVDYGAVFDGTPIPVTDADGNELVYRDFLGEEVKHVTWKLKLTGKAAVHGDSVELDVDQVGGIDLNSVPDPSKRKPSRTPRSGPPLREE